MALALTGLLIVEQARDYEEGRISHTCSYYYGWVV